MSSRSTALSTALPALAFLLLGGCMSFNPQSMRAVDTALAESNPDIEIASSFKLGVGFLTMDFIDFAFVHDRRIDISKISKAEIGVYELASALSVEDFVVPAALVDDRRCPRQEVIVRVRDDDEYVQVVACIKGEKVTGLAIFVLEPKEIVVINARGDLEALISKLIQDNINKKADSLET